MISLRVLREGVRTTSPEFKRWCVRGEASVGCSGSFCSVVEVFCKA
jgi:hypothetical protein